MFKLLSSLVLALALTFSPVYAEGKAPPMKGGPVSGIFSNLLRKLQDITLADLKAANALALAHGNQLGSTCYQAWINFIEEEQQAASGPDGKPIVLPPIHLIYDAEKLFDLLQALHPTSKLSVACAALKGAATSVTIPLPFP